MRPGEYRDSILAFLIDRRSDPSAVIASARHDPQPLLRPTAVARRSQDQRPHERPGGLAPKSVLQAHRILSEAMKHAVGLQLIPQNPCQLVRAPQVRRNELATLSPDAARRLTSTAAASNSVYGEAIIVALHTGMRMGELLGLKWEDIDVDGGRLVVRRTLQHLHKDGFVFQQPKTPKSRRTVMLGTIPINALKRQRHGQIQERLYLGAEYSEPVLSSRAVLAHQSFPPMCGERSSSFWTGGSAAYPLSRSSPHARQPIACAGGSPEGRFRAAGARVHRDHPGHLQPRDADDAGGRRSRVRRLDGGEWLGC